jgi:hypothetical protein
MEAISSLFKRSTRAEEVSESVNVLAASALAAEPEDAAAPTFSERLNEVASPASAAIHAATAPPASSAEAIPPSQGAIEPALQQESSLPATMVLRAEDLPATQVLFPTATALVVGAERVTTVAEQPQPSVTELQQQQKYEDIDMVEDAEQDELVVKKAEQQEQEEEEEEVLVNDEEPQGQQQLVEEVVDVEEEPLQQDQLEELEDNDDNAEVVEPQGQQQLEVVQENTEEAVVDEEQQQSNQEQGEQGDMGEKEVVVVDEEDQRMESEAEPEAEAEAEPEADSDAEPEAEAEAEPLVMLPQHVLEVEDRAALVHSVARASVLAFGPITQDMFATQQDILAFLPPSCEQQASGSQRVDIETLAPPGETGAEGKEEVEAEILPNSEKDEEELEREATAEEEEGEEEKEEEKNPGEEETRPVAKGRSRERWEVRSAVSGISHILHRPVVPTRIVPVSPPELPPLPPQVALPPPAIAPAAARLPTWGVVAVPATGGLNHDPRLSEQARRELPASVVAARERIRLFKMAAQRAAMEAMGLPLPPQLPPQQRQQQQRPQQQQQQQQRQVSSVPRWVGNAATPPVSALRATPTVPGQPPKSTQPSRRPALKRRSLGDQDDTASPTVPHVVRQMMKAFVPKRHKQ